MPKSTMSETSFEVKVGRSTTTPGRFMFLRSPITALFSMRQVASLVPGSSDRTVKTSDPSATKICCPAETDVHNCG